MADVFVSYKREDRARVKPLVSALEAAGLTVWWDVGIAGGETWRRTIEAALAAAKCVIVVWSKVSAGPAGEFVHDEASWGKSRGLYLPVSIDNVPLPLGFGQVQVFPLWSARGKGRDLALAAVIEAARAMVAGKRPPDALDVEQARSSGDRAFEAPDRPAIAVLPFGYPPGDQDQAYFAEGVAEDIIAGLARSKLLAVMPRQSSLTYQAAGLTTDRICADLGVEYIVQGQVRRMGGTVRVSAHLINGHDDKTVWSGRYDRPIDDLFAVQDEITAAVVGTLEPALLGHEEEQALRRPTRNLEHWDLFMRGRWHFWRGRPNDGAKARALLEQALALDPDDPPTLSLLSHCCLIDVWAGLAKDPHADIAEAHRFAMKAVRLDATDAFAHYTLGIVLSMTGKLGQATAEQRRALELNPYLAAAAGELARLCAFSGQVDEAVAHAEQAIRAGPTDPHVSLWYRAKALACFIGERPTEAVAAATEACVHRPDYFFLHYLLAACASAAGDRHQAAAALAEGRRRMPHYTLEALKLGHPFVDPAHLDRFVQALCEAGWQDAPSEAAAPGRRQARHKIDLEGRAT